MDDDAATRASRLDEQIANLDLIHDRILRERRSRFFIGFTACLFAGAAFLILLGVTVIEIREHRVRDRTHVCESAIAHYRIERLGETLGQRGQIDTEGIDPHLSEGAASACNEARIPLPEATP